MGHRAQCGKFVYGIIGRSDYLWPNFESSLKQDAALLVLHWWFVYCPEGCDCTREFCEWMNSLHANIWLSWQSSKERIAYLDTWVYVQESKLAVSPFKKPTDHNSYLHFNSFHPQHLKQNLPFGQFLHLKRNSTETGKYGESRKLSLQLEARGYPTHTIERAKEWADWISGQELFKPEGKINMDRMVGTFGYTPLSNSVPS